MKCEIFVVTMATHDVLPHGRNIRLCRFCLVFPVRSISPAMPRTKQRSIRRTKRRPPSRVAQRPKASTDTPPIVCTSTLAGTSHTSTESGPPIASRPPTASEKKLSLSPNTLSSCMHFHFFLPFFASFSTLLFSTLGHSYQFICTLYLHQVWYHWNALSMIYDMTLFSVHI